jgi:rhamnosyltransferase
VPLNNSNTLAIVVTYFPDANLPHRLQLLQKQFSRVVVVDNASQGEHLQMLSRLAGDGLVLIQNASNQGIAIALNQGLAYAKDHGYSNVVTFDQDSSILPNFLENLRNAWKALGEPIAIIGSNYVDSHRAHTRHRTSNSLPIKEVRTVISSGMFFPLALSDQIGGLLDDLFIDGVDHEFCLRARKQGHKVWLLLEPSMCHEIGSPINTHNILVKRFLPYNHPPQRKYYIARNTLHNIQNYWKQEPLWCIKRIAALLLKFSVAIFHVQRKEHLTALLLGMRDAWNNHLGKKELSAP